MIVVKIGGVVATNGKLLENLLLDLSALQNLQPVLVHGGGKEVTALGEKLGLKAEFRDGVRLTSPEEMDVVDMVLGGKINIDLVRRSGSAGLKSVGLGGQDGRLFVGEARSFSGSQANRTGTITKVHPELVTLLTESGYFPVIHSTCCTVDGLGLNINADEAAQELAVGLHAAALVYVSDIAGVLKDGAVISALNGSSIQREIDAGVIGGGMIPKVQNAWSAVQSGVGKVIIGGYTQAGDLPKLLSGVSGTTISAGA